MLTILHGNLLHAPAFGTLETIPHGYLVLEDGVIRAVRVLGGCHGNLQGISKLVEGMKVEEVIARLDGIRCGGKATSCPDQLAQALKQSI